jgi:hypothetical protein
MDTTESRSFAARLADLLRNEQHAMADFLVALAEFDRQRGWIALGYANFFDFLVRELGLSRGTAHYRKIAAYLVQRYPEVLDGLRQGTLCMTSIVELARVITPENRAEVLPRFLHCSKQEAKAVSAELAPRKVVPRREVVTTIRTAPAPAAPLSLQVPVGTLERPPVSPSTAFNRLNSKIRPARTPRSSCTLLRRAASRSSRSLPPSRACTSPSPGRF